MNICKMRWIIVLLLLCFSLSFAGEMLPYGIICKSSADKSKVVEAIRELPMPQRKLAAIDFLKKEAKVTQQDVISSLQDLGAQDIESHWLGNLVFCRISSDAIETISKLPEVVGVFPNKRVKLVNNLVLSPVTTPSDTAWGVKRIGAPTVWSSYGYRGCLLYTSPSPRDLSTSRMPSSA